MMTSQFGNAVIRTMVAVGVAGFISSSAALRWWAYYDIVGDLSLLLLSATLVAVIVFSQRIWIPPVAFATIPMTIVLLAGSFYAVSISQALNVVTAQIYFTVLFILLVLAITASESHVSEGVLDGLFLAGVILLLSAFAKEGFATIQSGWLGTDRVGYELSQPNTVGYVAAVASLVALQRALNRSSILSRYLYVASYVALGSIAFSTQSRRAFLALVIGTLLLLVATQAFQFRNFLSPRRIFVVILASFAVVTMLPLLRDQPRIRSLLGVLGGEFAGEVTASDQSRVLLVDRAWELFTDRPLWGWGTGSVRYLLDVGVTAETSAHNNLLDILANHGVMGFLAFYLPVFLILIILSRAALQSGDRMAGLLGTLVALEVFIAGSASVTYYADISSVILGLSSGYVAKIHLTEESRALPIKRS